MTADIHVIVRYRAAARWACVELLSSAKGEERPRMISTAVTAVMAAMYPTEIRVNARNFDSLIFI
jgi:hypothetical protein